jgi:hypothetical protein
VIGVAEVLVVLAAVSGSAWVMGMLGWLWHRVKRLEEQGGAGGTRPLASELEQIEGRLTASGRDLERLDERVDFLEKLLERGSEPPAPHRLGSPPDPGYPDQSEA